MSATRVQGSPCKNCGSTERYVRKNGRPSSCVRCALRPGKWRTWAQRPENRDRVNARARAFRKNLSPEKAAEYRLKKREQARRKRLEAYGLTVAAYDSMLAAQGGVCAICKRRQSGNLHVDHCHRTNAVRSLLCFNCNDGLGRFKDSVALLERAREYLVAHGGK